MKVPLTNIFVPQKIIYFSIRGAISGVGPWGLLACFAPPPSLPGLSLPLSQRPSHAAAAAAAVPTRRRRPVRFFVCGGAGGGGGGEQQQDGDGEGGDEAIALALHTLETHTGREPPPPCSRGGGGTQEHVGGLSVHTLFCGAAATAASAGRIAPAAATTFTTTRSYYV